MVGHKTCVIAACPIHAFQDSTRVIFYEGFVNTSNSLVEERAYPVKECSVVATRSKAQKHQLLQTHCTGFSRIFRQGILFLNR